LRGVGCATCNQPGFDPTKPALLYCFFVYHPDYGGMYKIGVTNRTARSRYLAWERKYMTLIYERVYSTGAEAQSVERAIIAKHEADRCRGPMPCTFSDREVFTKAVLNSLPGFQ